MYKRLAFPKLLNVRVYFLDPCYFLYLGAEWGSCIHVYSEVSLTRSSFKNCKYVEGGEKRCKRNSVDLNGVGVICGFLKKKYQVSDWKLVCFWISTFDTEGSECGMVHLISQTCPVYRNEPERLTFSCSYCFLSFFFFYILPRKCRCWNITNKTKCDCVWSFLLN